MNPASHSQTRVLAITLGDVNGIGPEIALKAARAVRLPPGTRLMLVGSRSAIVRECVRQSIPLPPVWIPSVGVPRARLVMWEPDHVPEPSIHPGRVRADAGRAAAAWVRAAAKAALTGAVHGLVTAPLCKEAMQRAGIRFPGHTELLAEIAGVRRVEMMLMAEPLRVVLATRHLPLRQVPVQLSVRGIVDTIRMTAQALRWLGLARRRIGVCGLNPHAGEGGVLGSEESRVIAPAVRMARRSGLCVTGPLPGDTAFHQAVVGEFDAVVAMYHDQGLAPLKVFGFDRGINLTLGLPFVRTSPDHGAAFDRAGRGTANPSSMMAALHLAATLVRRPNPWTPSARVP